MANKDSISRTVTVALVLCIVCSVVVSTAAVMLKPKQIANKELDFKTNILSAAGILNPEQSVEEQFKRISTKIVDLETGQYSDAVNVDSYVQRKAAKDPKLSEPLPGEEDIAKISRRERYAKVYIVGDVDDPETLILPVHGYGLWGTLYGFLALKGDLNTIKGLGYYDHKETPGLGAEVDNPKWKVQWKGKEIYAENGEVAIRVIKGKVDGQTENAEHKVDGLSGATLTSRGVTNMLQFWMGENGYGPYIDKLKKGEA